MNTPRTALEELLRCMDHDPEFEFLAASYMREHGKALSEALGNAARYEWLRDHCFINETNERPAPYVVMRVCVGEDDKNSHWMTPGHTVHVGIPSLDTAVDAAMKYTSVNGAEVECG